MRRSGPFVGASRAVATLVAVCSSVNDFQNERHATMKRFKEFPRPILSSKLVRLNYPAYRRGSKKETRARPLDDDGGVTSSGPSRITGISSSDSGTITSAGGSSRGGTIRRPIRLSPSPNLGRDAWYVSTVAGDSGVLGWKIARLFAQPAANTNHTIPRAQRGRGARPFRRLSRRCMEEVRGVVGVIRWARPWHDPGPFGSTPEV